ncbi:MAG TPA: phage/plasmid primase, P4 family, partial [Anaerolineales bacterium]|nr:phage/plasmid primase, P4 family [Anaerolineales bacterium]
MTKTDAELLSIAHASAADGESEHEPEPHEATDIFNAYLFLEQHGNRVRWCEQLRAWFIWDERRWAEDRSGTIRKLAHETVLSLADMAADAYPKNEDARKRLLKAAIASEASMRVSNMLREAKVPSVCVRAEDLDRDKELLVVRNGMIDLRRGDLLSFSPDLLGTRITDIDYDPSATCPKFRQALNLWLSNDHETAEFIKRAFGMSLTGRGDSKAFPFLTGHGDNGKTTLMETLAMVVGEYGRATSVNIILAGQYKGEANTPFLAELRGARFVYTGEMPENAKLHAARLKDITGGGTITAMAKYGTPFDLKLNCVLWSYGNYQPAIVDDSVGLWRRMRLVPFTHIFPVEDQRPTEDLLAEFREELPGILRWAVEGAMEALAVGVGTSPMITEATSVYRAEQDVVGQ